MASTANLDANKQLKSRRESGRKHMPQERILAAALRRAAKKYPIVAVTGPRQSGKTTLCKSVFAKLPYVNLEALDTRSFAIADPRGFLARYADGAIFDEVQHAPDLLSYLQVQVDQSERNGRFVLTGSQNFALSAAISQSLAGRVATMHLLPLSWKELLQFPNAPKNLFDALFQGSYPRIFDQKIPASQWLADYFLSYVQRDVRGILKVGDLQSFTRFVRLCAASSGQELNLNRLGADAGVSQPTAKTWLSVLETSFICSSLMPWSNNLRKRLVKAPKLFFWDSGLMCYLLGVQTAKQLQQHPLRGAVFETWVVAELIKQRIHHHRPYQAFHYREVAGMEVDLILQDASSWFAIEAKSGQTMDGSFLTALRKCQEWLPEATPLLIYGGLSSYQRESCQVLSWRDIDK
jgi:uncharacterized protein